MSSRTPIYGHSRGYPYLAALASLAVAVLVVHYHQHARVTTALVLGLACFVLLFVYSVWRAHQRIPVLEIREEGFFVCDPAQPYGIIHYEEIEEVRIYATLARPRIGVRLSAPPRVRRRGPISFRLFAKAVWPWQRYHIVIQLDEWNDQVASIKSVCAKAGDSNRK